MVVQKYTNALFGRRQATRARACAELNRVVPTHLLSRNLQKHVRSLSALVSCSLPDSGEKSAGWNGLLLQILMQANRITRKRQTIDIQVCAQSLQVIQPALETKKDEDKYLCEVCLTRVIDSDVDCLRVRSTCFVHAS